MIVVRPSTTPQPRIVVRGTTSEGQRIVVRQALASTGGGGSAASEINGYPVVIAGTPDEDCVGVGFLSAVDEVDLTLPYSALIGQIVWEVGGPHVAYTVTAMPNVAIPCPDGVKRISGALVILPMTSTKLPCAIPEYYHRVGRLST